MPPKGRKVKSTTKKLPSKSSSTSSSSSHHEMDNNTNPTILNTKIQTNGVVQPMCSVDDKRKHMEFMNEASDLLFDYRFESFVQNNWPFSEPEGDLCNPKELALAGLSFIKSDDGLCARCVVCAHVITKLEKNSDPWELHSKTNPNCIIIKIGKPSKPDGYTIKQLMDIFAENNIGILERAFKERIDIVTRSILALNELEDAQKKKDDF